MNIILLIFMPFTGNIMKTFFDEKINDTVFFASQIITAVSVTPLDNYRLFIHFSNDERKIYDVKPLLNKRIFAPLTNKSFFKTARIEGGTVVWNDEIDLCPEDLYTKSVCVSENNTHSE